MLIRATFGLFLSHNGGQTFDWVCESAVGYGGVQDPAVALTNSGAIVVAAFEGLATSHNQGCSFSFVDVTKKEFIIDVAIDRQNPSSAVAVSSTGTGNLSFHVQALETMDAGQSWAFIGTPIDPNFLAETIDPAPSRPQRLYVSGFSSTLEDDIQVRHGALYASDDRGQSWQRHDIDLAGDRSVFIAAVDPTEPDRVYLRTKGTDTDRLLRTDDGGKSFVELTSVPGAMLGFALSPDGTRVAVGGPTSGIRVADTTSLGFTQTSSAEVACLTWTGQGLYACGNPFKDGFVLGHSQDEGQTFEPVLASFQSLAGPLKECGTTPDPAALCAQEWAQFKSDFGIEEGDAGAGGEPQGAGVSGTGGIFAGAGGSPAGVGGAMAGAGTGPTAAGPGAISADEPSCSCESPGNSPQTAGMTGLLGLLGLLFIRRVRSHV